MSAYTDRVMARVRQRFDDSGMSLDDLGRRMGYGNENARRKSAWQFLNRTSDPRLSMVEKFAKAMECSVQELIDL